MKQQIKPSSGPSEVKQLSPVACVMTLVIVAVVVVVVVAVVDDDDDDDDELMLNVLRCHLTY